ncbi:hypothetical protein WJX82_005807 [Trebouxia sp. C0006]
MSVRNPHAYTQLPRSFLTRKSGGRTPYELLSHSGSAYAPLSAPKRMGVVLSLLAHLRSSTLHAIKGYTPQGNPAPHIWHKVLKFYPSQTGRLIVIGDVHGCAVELAELLVKVRYDQGRDKLVFVGDLVNKGPNSPQVVQIAMRTGACVVRGNHDDKALAAYRKGHLPRKSFQDLPSSEQWVEALKPDEAAFLAELPFTYAIPSHGLLVVHAGMIPNKPKLLQDWLDIYMMRNIDTAPAASQSEEQQDNTQYTSCPLNRGVPWASKWTGPDHIIFGHDAKRKLQQYQYATGLDTGCVYGGSLTACVMPIVLQTPYDENTAPVAPTLADLGAQLVSVPARQKYVATK